jgi:protease-4
MKNAVLKALCLVASAILLAGCMVFNIPGVQPLKEKAIGGRGDDKILVIDISGIIRDEDERGVLGVQTSANATARIKEALSKAEDDGRVRAVILRINSPGGAVTACDIISHEIRSFKARKRVPVVAELMDVAASGGYYIASSADAIMAHPTTVTGSIGVVVYSVNASGLMEKLGVAEQTIKSGDKKDIGTPLRRMTPEERDILQSIVNDMYERFLEAVMEGRKGAKGLTMDGLRKIADGRVYTANQALSLKLIDSIGYFDDAIAEAKRLSGIKDATIITYIEPSSYANNIYSMIPAGAAPNINLLNIDMGLFSRQFGLAFSYLWMP